MSPYVSHHREGSVVDTLAQARAFLIAAFRLTEAQLKQALVAGAGGGAIIAIWFFVLDTLAGRPLYTPTVLGTVLIGGDGLAGLENLSVSIGLVLLYTLAHALVFCFLGYTAVKLFVAAEQHPPYIFALLLFFIFFFCGFLTFVFLFALPALEVISSSSIVIGNLLAAGVMTGYLWRHHPLDLRKLL